MRIGGLMLIFCSLLLLNSDSFCEVKKKKKGIVIGFKQIKDTRGGGSW